jgi:hypothetical protein
MFSHSMSYFVTQNDCHSHEKRQSALLLYNIEALAANSEHADIGHCYGTGTLDCPVSHDKVKYIAGGYSLEGLY